ncbi:P-loop containing nucleoside triphosphate hydrolase protein [Guyanagaster necrorhizus]|uniref:P-loop containing nucleoside triphosphate hydrolase protein n=1 Tax=Guyanagaster necrorhizus TaxID=856835 RepID=A0A9P7VWK1_9AGAR|nr:P-loop containing nucleoside triphosphate hydrolase protein [Guyanagaster necrorhizus MCA 3950]KAG7448030.1 P-loop containing nucleoside triphosphate hydrolase protein [Guyanagaster necrorhizus MCA 3950]
MISDTHYAAKTKDLLGLVNQLHSLGAQRDLDLPRIAVIGNQSAGKSSVVEAISGINVPRDVGTCTRCPMECRLSSSSKLWQCKISIRREFDKNGERMDDISETPFGGVITDKSAVESILRRAQLSVLNPAIPIEKILVSTLDELTKWSKESQSMQPFSRNVVCVDLSGPDLTDLSFIDLPGLIQNAESNVVSLVEDLVVSHIKGNCLILVALPMTDDIENQKAVQLARREDPRGRRTIGVLTKPDMLTAGSTKALDLWLDVIEGRRHPLTHGYYCTRQPDDRDRQESITPEQARAKEKLFFETSLPWSKSTQTKRFGTNNLIDILSRLLIQVINETLPLIRSETMEALETCRTELTTIPTAINEEPATYMLKLVTSFSTEVQSLVRGRSNATHLIHENRQAFKDLKIAIRRTAPNFVPMEDGQPQPAMVNSLEDGEEEVLAPELSTDEPFTLTDMKRHIQSSLTRELPNNVPFEAKVELINAFQATWHVSVMNCFNRVQGCTYEVLIKCIEKDFSRYVILQGHLKTFIVELINDCRATCSAVLDATLEVEKSPFTQNTHYLEDTTDKWLAKYKNIRAGKTHAHGSVDHPAKRQKTEESASPSPPGGISAMPGPAEITNSSQQVNDTTSPRIKGAEKASDSAVPPQEASRASVAATQPAQAPLISEADIAAKADKVQEALAALIALGYKGLKPEDLGKLNPTDIFETELKVMAEVRGYFQVAYKRVIDNIPSFIDLLFVRKLAKELQPFLISKFGLGTAAANERCGRYLAEDPALVARREELTSREKRLMSVQKELISFGISTQA